MPNATRSTGPATPRPDTDDAGGSDVGDVAERQLVIEDLLLFRIFLCLRLAPGECRGGVVVVQVLEVATAQLAVEGVPLLAQLGAQRRKPDIQRLAHPRDVYQLQCLGLLFLRHEFGAQVPMLLAVVPVTLS